MDIRDKNVVLTGASGGIGRAIAEKLAAEGARLILVGRNEQKLAQLLEDIGGAPHCAIAADLGNEVGRQRLLEFCNNIGAISVLINNAGTNTFGFFEDQSQEAISKLININLLSPILICQDLLPLLRQQDDSQIVNIGSTFGSIGYPGFGAYCASKFGLRGFTESLRRELSGSGLQVSYIAPRATDTDLNSDNLVAMNDALGTAMDKPSLVANEVMQIINAPSGADKFLGWPEKIFVRINALLPSIVDSSLRKQLPIIRRFAKHGI
jgi:short-subunit dehydrogenase